MAHAVETALNTEPEDSAEAEAAEALFQAADEQAKVPRAHAADGSPLSVSSEEGTSSSPATTTTAAAPPQITATGLAPGATLWAPPRGASLASLFPDWAQVCVMSSIASSLNALSDGGGNGTSLSSLLAPPPACALISTPVARVPAVGAPSPVAPGTVVDIATGEPACPTLRVELIPSLTSAVVPAGALAAGRPPAQDAAEGTPGSCLPPSAACVCEVATSTGGVSSAGSGSGSSSGATKVKLRAGVTSVVAVRGARSLMGPVAGALPLFAAGPSPFASASSQPHLTVPHWVRPVVAGVGYASTVPEARFYASPTEADVENAGAISKNSSHPSLFARAVVVVGRGSPEKGEPLSALAPGITGDPEQLRAPATTFAYRACSTPALTLFVGEQPPPLPPGQETGPVATPVPAPTEEAPPQEPPSLLDPLATPTPAPTAAPERTPEAPPPPAETTPTSAPTTPTPAPTTATPAPTTPPAPVTAPSSPVPAPSPQQQPAFCALRVPLWGQCGGKGGSCRAAGAGRRPGSPCEDAAWTGACCGSGNECSRVNEWWWKCAPSASSSPSVSPASDDGKAPPPRSPPPPPSPSSPAPPVRIHKQCGGKAGDGCGRPGKPACADAPWSDSASASALTGGCEAGSFCRRDNEWYWQCARDEACTSSGSNKISSNGDVIVADWGQCGGTNGCPVGKGGVKSVEDCEGGGIWPGHECCGGGECVAVSGGYFSQCQPPK